MNKRPKVILYLSLVLNVTLIVGFGVYRSYMEKTLFRLAEMTEQAEVQRLEHIVSQLEPDEPSKIDALKQQLERDVETGRATAKIWHQVASD
ncbi:MAG: hypothetical protein ACYTBJ_20685 [Planctomycetota bacterium]|jgi:hypothetical protein